MKGGLSGCKLLNMRTFGIPNMQGKRLDRQIGLSRYGPGIAPKRSAWIIGKGRVEIVLQTPA